MLIYEICVVELWIEMNVYHPGSFLMVLRQEHPARPELFMAFSPPPKYSTKKLQLSYVHIHDFFFIVKSNIPISIRIKS